MLQLRVSQACHDRKCGVNKRHLHYSDAMIGAMVSQITSFTIFYWTVYLGAEQRKHQSSASLAFVRGIHRWPVNEFPAQMTSNSKRFPFDAIIM